jgi:regulator of protease activity HflC (stomatin/prohibitin superfamily)
MSPRELSEALVTGIGSSLFTLLLFAVAIIIVARAIRVVPQQHAFVVERLGRFRDVLQPG